MSAIASNSKQWLVGNRDKEKERRLERELTIPSLLAAILVTRGYESPEDANKYLNPKIDDLYSPLLLPDCEEAVRFILNAKELGHKVFVHGDYDVDGVSSAAIWTRCLRRLGFDVTAHVPHRIREGYGIHEDAVKSAAETGAKLFITCDCGSSALNSIELARELGMTVVVTDHHEIGATKPNAHAFVNPHRHDSKYPFPSLAGAGVAYKVAQAVSNECGATNDQFSRAFLDLVCLGTISDVVPLIDENRILASLGLDALNHTKKAGLIALKKVSDLKSGAKVSSRDVGWRIGPRINASGRIDDAAHALKLLMEDDVKEATQLAELLNKHNFERQREQKRVLEHAEELVMQNGLHEKSLIFVHAPGWHPGIVGIVAGRLANKFYRPTLVGTIDEETGIVKGSARSIPGFSLYSAFETSKELFDSCGGHEMAAGFSARVENIDQITEVMIAIAEKSLGEEGLIPKTFADIELEANELTAEAIESLTRLEPFGEGNRQPEFVIRNVRFSAVSTLPNYPDHVRFTLDLPNPIAGLAWNMAEQFESIFLDKDVDVLFRTEFETWNGKQIPKVFLTDVIQH